MSAWARLRHSALSVYAGIAVAYMLIPIAVIAVFSFNDPAGKFNFTWQGLTLDHWRNVFGVEELNDALLASLKLAGLSTLGATIFGTLIALALVRHQFRGRRATNFLIVIPMATPEVVIGAALLSMFVYFEATLGFETLLIAHIMFSISFVAIVVRSRLIGFDRSLEEAARDLGAGWFETFRLVTLPLILPGVAGGALLAFALSIDDFVISNFNAGDIETFPLLIWAAYQGGKGVPVEVNGLATILFAITVAAMAFTVWQQRRAERLAAIRPDRQEPYGSTPAFPPAPGAAGG